MAFVELAKSVYQGQHKAKPKALTSVEEGKYVRIQKQAKERRSKRIETFFTNRDINDDDDILLTPQSETGPVPKKDVVSDPRKRQMLQWKEERMKRKKLEPKKPPPFKVGVVRHHLDPLQDVVFKNPVKGATRITRATAKAIINAASLTHKSFAPANAVFHAPKVAVHNNKNLKNTPKKSRAKSGAPFKLTNVLNAIQPSKVSNIKPFDFKYNMPKVRTPIKVKKNSSSGISKVKRQSGKFKRNNLVGVSKEKRLDVKKAKRAGILRRSLRKSIDIQCGSKQTVDNSKTPTPEKKEKAPVSTPTNKRLSRIISKPLEMSVAKSSDKSVTPNDKVDSSEELVISSPFVTVARGKCSQRRETLVKMQLGFQVMSPEKTAQYFRLQLEREIERLQGLCDKWKTYQSSHQELSEDAHDLINLAIGQTQLLMNKKLQQFRGLVVRCESKEEKEGEGIVTSQDLQGFWDMVYMQVENVDLRFQKLDEMEKKNWVEDDAVPKVKRNKRGPVKAAKPQSENPKATSSLKAMIQAARKKTKMSESIPSTAPSTLLRPDTITFNGGFFSVVSPVKNAADEKETTTAGRRASLLKAIVEMEAKKRLSSAKTPESTKAIMKASRISKNITNNMDMLIAVDLKKTPAKSILKTPAKNNTSVKKGPRKSLKVLFSDCSEENTEDVASKRDISVLEEMQESELNRSTECVLMEDFNPDKNRKRGKLKRQRAVSSKFINNENTPPTKSLDVDMDNNDATPNVYNMRKRKSDDRHLLETNLNDSNTDIKPSRRSKRKLTNETELKSLLPPDPDESAKVKRSNRKSLEERKSINLISFSPEQPKQHTRYALRRMSMNVT